MTTRPRAARSTKRHLAPVDTTRAFRLTITPGKGDTYGVILEEAYGDPSAALTAPVITTSAAQTARVIDAVLAAARGSGHPGSAIAFTRTKPLTISEPDGVRLALVFFATQPIAKHSRVRALVAGINAMSTEETYYWYSKCVGPDAPRARRALRILLADD